eukprot:5990872-Amphidinium_carterae.2
MTDNRILKGALLSSRDSLMSITWAYLSSNATIRNVFAVTVVATADNVFDQTKHRDTRSACPVSCKDSCCRSPQCQQYAITFFHYALCHVQSLLIAEQGEGTLLMRRFTVPLMVPTMLQGALVLTCVPLRFCSTDTLQEHKSTNILRKHTSYVQCLADIFTTFPKLQDCTEPPRNQKGVRCATSHQRISLQSVILEV